MTRILAATVVACFTVAFLTAGAEQPWHEEWKLMLDEATAAREAGDADRAGELLRDALLLAQSNGPGTIRHARNIDELAYHYLLQENHAESEALYVEAAGMWERLLGPDQPRLATALQNLAVVRMNLEKYQEAEQDILRALEIWKTRYGDEHPLTVGARKTHRALLQRKGKGS